MFICWGFKMKLESCDVCEHSCLHPQAICLAKEKLPPPKAIGDLSELFKLIGDPTRLKILLLLQDNELCVCDIADALKMGQSAISHQLRLLRGARLVKFHKEGKSALYSLDDAHVLNLIIDGLEHVQHD